MKLKELLLRPVVAVATVVSVIGGAVLGFVPGLEPLWSFAAATSGTWFSIASVTGGVVLPELGFQTWGTRLLLGGAAVFIGVQANKLIERFLKNRE